METSRDESWWSSVDIIIRIIQPIVLGVGSYMGAMYIDHEVRITRIESNRYTQTDAAKDIRDATRLNNEKFTTLMRELSQIRESLARFKPEK